MKKRILILVSFIVVIGIGLIKIGKQVNLTNKTIDKEEVYSDPVSGQPEEGLKEMNGYIYYFKEGKAVTGLQEINGTWYSFDDLGKLQLHLGQKEAKLINIDGTWMIEIIEES